MSKGPAPVWCEIIFHTANTPKRFDDVRRMYTKAGWLCIELPDKDDWGRPVVKRFPMSNIFSVDSPHVLHYGAGKR